MDNKTTNKVAKSLNLVLADSYALMAQTHFCHWNVEGPGFFALHNAFEEQYTELFTAIDEIAERVRALGKGHYAEGGLANLAKLSGIEELSLPADDKAMVTALVKANEKLVKDAAKTRDLAGDAGDSETEDLMIGRITVHEKTLWMLRSYLR
jgi:starvation-inducible DNA-binding protein